MDKKHRVLDVQLDKEEQELLESVEAGEWKIVDNLEEEIAIARTAARNFLKQRLKAKEIDLETIFSC